MLRQVPPVLTMGPDPSLAFLLPICPTPNCRPLGPGSYRREVTCVTGSTQHKLWIQGEKVPEKTQRLRDGILDLGGKLSM